MRRKLAILIALSQLILGSNSAMTPVACVRIFLGRKPEDIPFCGDPQSQYCPVDIIEIAGNLIDLQDFPILESSFFIQLIC